MKTERRKEDRQRTNLWVKEIEGDYYYLRNATNISKSGMFLEAGIPKLNKKELKLSVHLPNRNEVRFTGKVVHSANNNSTNGLGIEFLNFELGKFEDLLI